MNDFQTIMYYAWSLMCTEFEIYGFTLSYGLIYLWVITVSIVVFATVHFLWK